MGRAKALIRPLDIGGVTAPTNLVLSPMSGVTDCAFRSLVREMSGGALGLVVTEFISSEGLTRGNAKTRAMLRSRPAERPLSIQIFGADPERMATAALMAEQAGADLVDVNCGCPAPKVVRRGGGAELMRQPARLRSILRAVRARISVPMTVKIRAGWDQGSLNALDIARLAAEEGAAALAVHGRTRRALYSGQADWELVARVASELDIPVLGSGDLTSPASVLERLAASGAAGVMIGRAAIDNPWIFAETGRLAAGRVPEPAGPADRARAISRFQELLAETLDERAYIGRLRGIACRLVKGLPRSAALRQAIGRAASAAEVVELSRQALMSGQRFAEVA